MYRSSTLAGVKGRDASRGREWPRGRPPRRPGPHRPCSVATAPRLQHIIAPCESILLAFSAFSDTKGHGSGARERKGACGCSSCVCQGPVTRSRRSSLNSFPFWLRPALSQAHAHPENSERKLQPDCSWAATYIELVVDTLYPRSILEFCMAALRLRVRSGQCIYSGTVELFTPLCNTFSGCTSDGLASCTRA